jgi:hypothetical protein
MRASKLVVSLASLTSIAVIGCSGDGSTPPNGQPDAFGADATRADGGTPTDAPGSDARGVDGGSGNDASSTSDAGALDDAGSDPCAGVTCAAGFTCGAGGYCANAAGVPAFGHVYVAVFENRSLSSVSGNAPYLDGLGQTYASATNYVSVAHPSLPNYIAMTSGDVQGISCDCSAHVLPNTCSVACAGPLGICSCEVDVMHLGDQLDAAGLTWREYGESMGTPCNAMDVTSAHYAMRHLPFLYYNNVLSNSARCTAHVRDFGDFGADMGSYRFSMISPNLCDDMHDTCGGDAIAHGDTWASTNLAPIVNAVNASTNDVLFIVWDEEDNSTGRAPIPFIVVSPLVTPGATTAAAYDHYSLLATWEDGLGLTRLGMAAGAPVINDIWR